MVSAFKGTAASLSKINIDKLSNVQKLREERKKQKEMKEYQDFISETNKILQWRKNDDNLKEYIESKENSNYDADYLKYTYLKSLDELKPYFNHETNTVLLFWKLSFHYNDKPVFTDNDNTSYDFSGLEKKIVDTHRENIVNSIKNAIDEVHPKKEVENPHNRILRQLNERINRTKRNPNRPNYYGHDKFGPYDKKTGGKRKTRKHKSKRKTKKHKKQKRKRGTRKH